MQLERRLKPRQLLQQLKRRDWNRRKQRDLERNKKRRQQESLLKKKKERKRRKKRDLLLRPRLRE